VIVNVIYFIFGVMITMLALRFVLLLFGANPSAGFSQLIYGLTDPLMAPFYAVFGTTRIEGAVFEWSALLAIVIYALLAWGLAALVTAVSPRASAGTVETQEESHHDAADEHARDYDAHEPYEDQHRHGGGPVVHR
jgi:uncharacterized protein YggT (Ycf19 family)